MLTSLPELAARIDSALEAALPSGAPLPAVLTNAMHHAVIPGGKRLRPALVCLLTQACGGDLERAVATACAFELVHCQSLILDDLPCMDDDELRRGRPTTHKLFGEANAILAAQALLTLANDLVLADLGHSQATCAILERLSEAAGARGIVSGQVLDLAATNDPSGDHDVEAIHVHKTAVLIRSACVAGTVVAEASPAQRALAADYGQALGLCFQITDDILDMQGTTASLGKTAGKDVQQHKLTYPAVFGIEAAKHKAEDLSEAACAALLHLPANAARQALHDLARKLPTRTH